MASRTVEKADATISAVNEQRQIADELAEMIANPGYGDTFDEASNNLYNSSRF